MTGESSNEAGNYACPDCGGLLEFSHEDDVHQKWYGCTKCGKLTSEPQKKVAPSTSSKKPRPPAKKDQCGTCAYLWTPKCEYIEDFKKGLMTSTDKKCSSFHPKQEGDRRKFVSQADKLVHLCVAKTPIFFHDQYQTAYLKLQKTDGGSILRVRSRLFKSWLASLLWDSEEKAPGSEALASAVNVLECKAIFHGSRRTLYNRVAPAEDGFWIDMTDEQWRAIKVTSEGWEIVDDPPILFRRYSHQWPMVEPKRGGDPWRFLNFVNIDRKDEGTRLTLLCTVISYFIPLIPHAIITPYGIQGSGKTFLFTLIRRVIDPSVVDTLTLPRSERERIQQLDHNWCAFYDNITYLQSWMSETLCRAVTGSGFTKRRLYTDSEDVTCSFKRCVGLGGINIAAQRGDLLDRVLLVKLSHIPKDKRRKEQDLLAEFEGCKAEILGAFLDTLVKAIRIYPTVQLQELFRMADFTQWGCAIAIALGKTKEDFINAYDQKVRTQIQEAAFADPVAMVLMAWINPILKMAKEHIQGNNESPPWTGTPSELLTALNSHAKDEMKISTRQKAWPKAPHILVRRLNELAPSLRALGLEVITGVRTSSARRVIIRSVNSVTSVTEKHDGDANDATDAILQSCSSGPLMLNVKTWGRTHRNERSEISLEELSKFIRYELKQSNPQHIIQTAYNQAILMGSPNLGMAVVV